MVQITKKQTAVHNISQRNLNRKRHGTTPESVEIHYPVINFIKEPSKGMNIQPAHLPRIKTPESVEIGKLLLQPNRCHPWNTQHEKLRKLILSTSTFSCLSLSSLLPQGRGSCCIPYSQLALSREFLPFVSLSS